MTPDEHPVVADRLHGLDTSAVRHPADRAATAALEAVPGLTGVLTKIASLGYERALRQDALASTVRLGPQQLPEVWRRHETAYTLLGITPVPPLYLGAGPIVNAAAFGTTNPHVAVTSELVEELPEAQQRVVLAHEAGHVLCGHNRYGTALQVITSLGSSVMIGMLPTSLPLQAVRLALLEWSRAAELTCDRVAALVVGDPLLVCRSLLTVAGGTAAERLDLDAFLAQAAAYDEEGTGLRGRWSRLSLELGATHPLAVKRAQELMTWVRGGDYEAIRDGRWRRVDGEDGSASGEARAAAAHYRERFEKTFKDFSGDVQETTKSVQDWLQRNAPRP